MKRIAKFEKVSFNEFKTATLKFFDNKYNVEQIREFYDKIELPKRATKGSAGYDFKCPYDIVNVNKTFPSVIPTGIRVKIDDGWVLKIYPRSGLGFKYGVKLLNTVGIIDSDYCYSDNEGHILTKIFHTEGDYLIQLKQGNSFVQGVFVEYGITVDDDATETRNGGFGSTGK